MLPIWLHLGQIPVELTPDRRTTRISLTRLWPMKTVLLTHGVRSLDSTSRLQLSASSTCARNT